MKKILPLMIGCLCATLYAADKPNIVLLFADDAGYGDFGFHHSRHIKTPHLDRLAQDGIVMTQFYVTGATCGPSRAGLLSGMYQQRFGFEEINVPGIMSPHSKLLGDDMGLPTDLPTLGNYLQELGYRTAAFGKWHMGVADRYHPFKRGFDEFCGFRGGARNFFPYPDLTKVKHENWLEYGFKNYKEPERYMTDTIAEAACSFIERNKDRPFFAYVAFNAVHTPMQPDPDDADTFPELSGTRRKLAQMTLSMDRACGRIIDRLKALGLYENTLIVFSNDNGGPMDKNGSSNYPFAGVKGTQLEGGIRVPGVITWPARLPAGGTFEAPAITLDLAPTFVKAGGGTPADNLDGVDLLPYLTGEKQGRPHQVLHWKMETRGAIRDGDWKLLRFPDRPPRLHNLADDPGEQVNLAAQYPEKVAELFKKQFEWEMTLQRPLFMLRRQEEAWSARRADEFAVPPSPDY